VKGVLAALVALWLGAGGAADDSGTLDLRSDPVARVTIDEKDTGQVTPAAIPLKAGHHKLLLVTLDGKRQRAIGFTIETHQTTHLSIHLSAPD
jgi:hypothetical protein